jgi:hypothetical protein
VEYFIALLRNYVALLFACRDPVRHIGSLQQQGAKQMTNLITGYEAFCGDMQDTKDGDEPYTQDALKACWDTMRPQERAEWEALATLMNIDAGIIDGCDDDN